MRSIQSLFASIEAPYRRLEELFRQAKARPEDGETLVRRCMEPFGGLYLDDRSRTALEAYFRYLVSSDPALSDIPFNFLLQEDERADGVLEAFLQALSVLTGAEQPVRTVAERALLDRPDEELGVLGDCSVLVIDPCETAPMSPEDTTAWNAAAELFELTPRVVKILRAPREVIENRFRAVDHIYYRVFRNSLRTREITPRDMYDALLNALSGLGFGLSEDFARDMADYLETVYPKADLRGEDFVRDLVERVVQLFYRAPRESKTLDAACVPFYRRPEAREEETEPELPQAPEPEPEPEPGFDDPVNDYRERGCPTVKSLLVVSLSTFPFNFAENTCRLLGKDGEEPLRYRYQQEPFPWQLREALRDAGEILMLTTRETLKRNRDGSGEKPLCSPQRYFMERVREMPGLEAVIFRSVEVDQDAPIGAVSEVVEHLREIKRNNENKVSPEIYLGTNGGLRSIQLILEAILSLLRTDNITIHPDHVFSARSIGKNRWEIYQSAEEFRVFDFVSGINEFLNYGRIDSLQKFVKESSDFAGQRLVMLLKMISESIQYCCVSNFEKGLDFLGQYFQNPGSEDPYILMFENAIRMDYGALLTSERTLLSEIEWCYRKGFYQQCYTLIEGALPRKLVQSGAIVYSPFAKKLAKEDISKGYYQQSVESWLFNRPVLAYAKASVKQWSKVFQPEWNSKLTLHFTDQPELKNAVSWMKNLLKKHVSLKEKRNILNHAISDETTVREYSTTLTDAVKALRTFYSAWDGHSALLYID